jgi:hypothetical protein
VAGFEKGKKRDEVILLVVFWEIGGFWEKFGEWRKTRDMILLFFLFLPKSMRNPPTGRNGDEIFIVSHFFGLCAGVASLFLKFSSRHSYSVFSRPRWKYKNE